MLPGQGECRSQLLVSPIGGSQAIKGIGNEAAIGGYQVPKIDICYRSTPIGEEVVAAVDK